MNSEHIRQIFLATMTAATFAEEGEHRTALEILREREVPRKAPPRGNAERKNHVGTLQPAA